MVSYKRASIREGLYGVILLTITLGIYCLLPTSSVAAGEPPKELVEAAKKEGALIYWGTDAETAPKFSKAFEKKYPFMKKKIEFWDAKSHEVMERIITEAKAGRHSVDIISVSEGWLNRLNKAGQLAKHEWTNVKQWGMSAQPDHGMWVNAAIDPRPAVYNTTIISPDQAPKGYEGLISSKLKGKSALSDASEEFPFVYAYLWKEGDKLNWEKSFDYFRRLVKTTKPSVVNGYTGPTRLLAAGAFGIFHIGLFSRSYQMIKKGAPLGLVPFKSMYGSVASFAIPKNAPHPAAAELYAYWLTTTEGSVAFADLLGKFPYNPTAENAKPLKVAKKFGITRDMVVRIPTEVWNKKYQNKSSEFYYKLLGLK